MNERGIEMPLCGSRIVRWPRKLKDIQKNVKKSPAIIISQDRRYARGAMQMFYTGIHQNRSTWYSHWKPCISIFWRTGNSNNSSRREAQYHSGAETTHSVNLTNSTTQRYEHLMQHYTCCKCRCETHIQPRKPVARFRPTNNPKCYLGAT